MELNLAHQPGWIELYEALEREQCPPPDLVALCKLSRSGIGETMLHWYAIEGAPDVLQKLIDLGFSVNVKNNFGKTPLMECSQIERWDNAKVLLDNGADTSITNNDGLDYVAFLDDIGVVDRPEWARHRA